MDWASLERYVPYVEGRAPAEALSMATELPAPEGMKIRALQPGKYWAKTSPLGGDFLIEVTSAKGADLTQIPWNQHRFRHIDLFVDAELKTAWSPEFMQQIFAPALVQVVRDGADPFEIGSAWGEEHPALPPLGLLVISQCLALCEHRRWAAHEPLGGRFLPARFLLGVIFTRWSSVHATSLWSKGKYGLEDLRKLAGLDEPSFEKVLAAASGLSP